VKRAISIALPVVVSAGFVYWIVQSIEQPSAIWDSIRGASLPLVAAIVPLSLLSHWFRATRWCRFIGGPVSRGYAFSSVMIGYVVNLIIPRGGEVARVVNMNRMALIPYPRLFATLIAERILDVLVLLALLGLSFQLDGERLGDAFPAVARLGPTLLAAAIAGLIAMGVLGFAGERLARFAGRTAGLLHTRLGSWAENVAREGAEGFSFVRNPARTVVILGETAAIWGLYCSTFALGLAAFGLLGGLGWRGTTVVFSVASASVVVPSQGAIGVFHSFGEKALSQLYGIGRDQALACITVIHAVLFLGVAGVGGVLVWGAQAAVSRGRSPTAVVS
jgi:hypothetical protein